MPDNQTSTDEIVASRTFWSGTITFGLVSVPVRLLPANRSERVSLRMVSPEGRPLSRRYFAPHDNRPLEWDDLVRGYEIEKDEFVVLDDDELERLAPERTRDIDLRVFVKASEIDPMHFERAYFLTPADDTTKAYRLLAKVMEETGRAGIATFVMRAKEYLVAILAENGILRAETLRFADELRTPESIGLPEPEKPSDAAVKKLEKQIAKLEEKKLSTKELEDRSAERLLKLVRKKQRKGEDTVKIEEEPSDSTAVIDLVEALQRSLKGNAKGKPKSSSSAGKSAGAKKSGSSASAKSSGSSKGNGKAKSSGKSKADELEDATKSELYERAQELDISGRSSMSKDELVAAIREST